MSDLSPAARLALSATKAGWYVFPIRKGSKKPPLVPHWREDSSKDPAQVMRWSEAFPDCNWGLDCGRSRLLVLDLDGEEGMRSFAQLEVEYGTFEPTFTVATPSGGMHYYFRGVGRTTARKVAPGMDTRGEGGYVVFPGSMFNGRGYRIVTNDRPAKLPEWLGRLLEKSAPVDAMERPEAIPVMLDAPSHVERARSYLESRDGAVQGDGGDHWTYETACAVREFGISEALALDLMLELFNPKCLPPWGADEMRQKVRNAYKYAQEPLGADTPEADFEGVVVETQEAPRPPDLPVPASDILALRPHPRNWIIEEWLPKGEIASLYGDGGQGKSLVALQLALSAALNTPWLGLSTTKEKMMVFCLFCEDTDDELNRRLHSAVAGLPTEGLDRLRIWCRPGRASTLYTAMPNGEIVASTFFSKLKEQLLRHKDIHKLVILDTLADIYSGSEINREHVSKFIKVGLRALALSTNSTILFLAHPSRAGMKDGDLLSGSTAWSNSVRMRWTLTPHKENPDIRVLTRAKSNYSSRGETLLLSYDQGRFVSIQEAAAEETDADYGGLEAEAKIVLSKIIRAAQAGHPYGYRRPAENPITMAQIRDTKRRSMSSDFILKCVDFLIKMQYVEHRKRVGTTRKALWPVGAHPESVTELLT